jgi:hypothetical protein
VPSTFSGREISSAAAVPQNKSNISQQNQLLIVFKALRGKWPLHCGYSAWMSNGSTLRLKS